MPTTDWLMERECPVCGAVKCKGMILCMGCWDKVFPETRRWLRITDVCSDQRRLHFYDWVEKGVNISDSITMPGKKELMRARAAARKMEATDGQ